MFVAYKYGRGIRADITSLLASVESGSAPDPDVVDRLKNHVSEEFGLGNCATSKVESTREFLSILDTLMCTNPRDVEAVFDLGIGHGVVRIDEHAETVTVKRFYWSD